MAHRPRFVDSHTPCMLVADHGGLIAKTASLLPCSHYRYCNVVPFTAYLGSHTTGQYIAMPRFETISNFFTVDGSGLYIGRAVVSEEALYLVAGLAPLSITSLFSGGIGKQIKDAGGPLQVPLSALPVDVISDPTWPIASNEGFACIISRESIRSMHCSLAGNLRLSNAEHTAVIRSGVVKRFTVLRILRRLGWPV